MPHTRLLPRFAALVLAFCAVASTFGADVTVSVNMNANIDRLWVNMPQSGDAVNVTLVGETQPDCATAALRLAKSAVATEAIAAGAWKSFTTTLDVVQDVMGLGGLGGVADAMEVTVAVVDGWPDPGNILTELGKVATKKLSGAALGAATTKWNDLASDQAANGLAELAGSKVGGAIYSNLVAGNQKIKSTTCSYFCACNPVQIDFWVTTDQPPQNGGTEITLASGTKQTIGDFRLNMNVTVAKCNCKYGKPVKIESYVVHASVPMTITARKVSPLIGSDYIEISLSVSGAGDYSVDAKCCGLNGSEDASYSPLDDDASYALNSSYPVSMNLPGMVISGDSNQLCNFASWSQFVPFSDPSYLSALDGPPQSADNPIPGGGLRPSDPTQPGAPNSPNGGQPTGQPASAPSPNGLPSIAELPELPYDNPFAVTGLTTYQPQVPIVPQSADDGEDAEDGPPPPEEDPEPEPVTPPRITVEGKIKQTVIEQGQLVDAALAGAVIQIDIETPPALPVQANADDRDTESGAQDPPVTGIPDAEGNLLIAFDAPVGYNGPTSLQFAADMTPHDGRLLKFPQNDQFNCGGLSSILPGPLQSIISDCFENPGLPDGSVEAGTFVTLLYPDWWMEPEGISLGAPDLDALISGTPGLIYDEPAPCTTTAPAPNDPYFHSHGSWGQDWDDQWAIHRVGFGPGENSAWELVDEGLEPVVVAVIDTGLDWNHLDLTWDNIWSNPREIPGNGIDDDANGYVDDLVGWDFVGRDNEPWDSNGHGTFVAGLIAAQRDNGIGISGIAPNAKIMILRALDSFGHSRASLQAKAIVYAADNGARVINMSVESPALTRTEQEAVTYARHQGTLVVLSAGNSAQETIAGTASVEGALVVSATDPNDERAVFSNWGSQVDIAAPGVDVLSLRARRTDLALNMPDVEYVAGSAFVGEDKRYYRSAGTSFSAPLVAAAAAVILGKQPGLSVDQVERMILQSARDIGEPGNDRYTGYGLLDARAAITADPDFFVEAAVTGVAVAVQDGVQVVQVLGTADANDFGEVQIEIGMGDDPDSWKVAVAGIEQSVVGGVIGAVPAQQFAGSRQWTIRVVTTHANGKRREARFLLTLG